MSIKHVKGDILTAPTRNEETIICHQVNCRAAMGAGLARQIRDKWPDVYDRYRLMVETCGEFMLGSFHEVKVGPHLYVANLYGQVGYGRDKRYTNYAALTAALFKGMKEYPRATFRIPYGLGCGLAGGDWETVLNIIKEISDTWNVNVEIWVLPKK